MIPRTSNYQGGALLDLTAGLELLQSGGLFAFAWVVWQEVRALRGVLHDQATVLSKLEERTRDLVSEVTP